MQFYKAPDQSLHHIETAFSYLLPVGSTPISDEEAQALIDAIEPILPSPAEQIEALEREHMMPRATREFMLTFMETNAIQQGGEQGLTPEQSISALRVGNSGYRKVKELDEQISALRAQL